MNGGFFDIIRRALAWWSSQQSASPACLTGSLTKQTTLIGSLIAQTTLTGSLTKQTTLTGALSCEDQ